jgi:uncharacterized membrane protein YcgQ (UPF0703/DUF1980 family)
MLLSACDGGASGRANDVANDVADDVANADAPKNGGGTSSVNVSQGEEVDTREVIEIGEKMFVGQMNDIYLNPDDYLGRTIRYEGFYTYFENEETGQRYDCIVRNGPGCCGYDSSVGFEVDWKGDLPTVDDWCSVQGVVDIYKENGLDYIVVRADELDVLPYRGEDTVVQ